MISQKALDKAFGANSGHMIEQLDDSLPPDDTHAGLVDADGNALKKADPLLVEFGLTGSDNNATSKTSGEELFDLSLRLEMLPKRASLILGAKMLLSGGVGGGPPLLLSLRAAVQPGDGALDALDFDALLVNPLRLGAGGKPFFQVTGASGKFRYRSPPGGAGAMTWSAEMAASAAFAVVDGGPVVNMVATLDLYDNGKNFAVTTSTQMQSFGRVVAGLVGQSEAAVNDMEVSNYLPDDVGLTWNVVLSTMTGAVHGGTINVTKGLLVQTNIRLRINESEVDGNAAAATAFAGGSGGGGGGENELNRVVRRFMPGIKEGDASQTSMVRSSSCIKFDLTFMIYFGGVHTLSIIYIFMHTPISALTHTHVFRNPSILCNLIAASTLPRLYTPILPRPYLSPCSVRTLSPSSYDSPTRSVKSRGRKWNTSLCGPSPSTSTSNRAWKTTCLLVLVWRSSLN